MMIFNSTSRLITQVKGSTGSVREAARHRCCWIPREGNRGGKRGESDCASVCNRKRRRGKEEEGNQRVGRRDKRMKQQERRLRAGKSQRGYERGREREKEGLCVRGRANTLAKMVDTVHFGTPGNHFDTGWHHWLNWSAQVCELQLLSRFMWVCHAGKKTSPERRKEGLRNKKSIVHVLCLCVTELNANDDLSSGERAECRQWVNHASSRRKVGHVQHMALLYVGQRPTGVGSAAAFHRSASSCVCLYDGVALPLSPSGLEQRKSVFLYVC